MTRAILDGLDLNLLRLLDALGNERSTTKAAAKLGLSQPAVSRALKRLRLHFKDQLFVAGAGGLMPTQRAETLRQPLQEALSNLERALSVPALNLETWTGPIRLAMLDMEEFLTLPPLLRRVGEAALNLRIEAVPLLSLSVAQLQDGAVDVMIGPIKASGGPYSQQKLYEDRFVCVVNAASRFAAEGLTAESYAAARHVHFGLMESDRPSQVEASLRGMGIRRNLALRIHSFAAAPHILAEIDLVMTTNLRVATRFAAIAPLKILPLPVPVDDLVVFQFWHERDQDDLRHKWFRGLIKEVSASV